MKLKQIFTVLSVMLIVGIAPAFGAKKSVFGIVTCDGIGVPGVVVSDGVNVATTDAKGYYALPTKVKDPHCQFVRISVPSGYEAERVGNAPRFFYRIDPRLKKQSHNFKLVKVDQSVYTVLAIADTHVCGGVSRRSHKDDRARYINQFVPALNDAIAKSEGRVYVFALGDMTQTGSRPGWKGRPTGYSLKDYLDDTKIDAPLFNVIGNHDHNHAPQGEIFNNETVYQSRADFNRDLGPEYYSFNVGRDHYVVLDNTFVITKDSGPTNDPNATKGYWTRICDYQNRWLEKDIAALDRSKVDRIVVALHCGIFGYAGKKNQMDAEAMLEKFKGFEVIALIGHHHSDHSIKKTLNGKPFYQFIHPSGAGTAWYTPNNGEGTPGAIVGYTFKDGKVKREYFPYGENVGVKYRVYDNGEHKWHYPITSRTGTKQKRETEVAEATPEDKPAILVNIWNAYTCEFTESTGGKGKTVKRCFDLNFRDWYWATYAKSEAGELPHGERLYKAKWQRPKRGYHLWRYIPADADAEIRVVAKDAFGNVIADFKARAR